MILFGFALPIARATGLSEIAVVGARSLDIVLARATRQFEFALRYQLECAGAFGSELSGAFDVIIGNVAIHMVVRDVTPGCDISTDDLGLRTLARPTVAKGRRSGFECHGRVSQNMTRLVRNDSVDFGQRLVIRFMAGDLLTRIRGQRQRHGQDNCRHNHSYAGFHFRLHDWVMFAIRQVEHRATSLMLADRRYDTVVAMVAGPKS